MLRKTTALLTVTAAASNGDATVGRPRLVFFCSKASGRSRRVEGFLSQVLQRRRNHESVEVLKVDVGENAKLVEHFGRRGADDRRRGEQTGPGPPGEPARQPRHRAAALALAEVSWAARPAADSGV